MKVIRTLKELKDSVEPIPSGVAIGTFDGLHIGHQEVIRTLLTACAENSLRSVVYTFANHPREFTNRDALPNRILTVDEKIDLLDGMGIDLLVMVEFDREHMEIEAEAFVENVLLDGLGMAFLAAGYNFHFGRQARGNSELLKQMGADKGFGVSVVPPFTMDGAPVSSSRIRELLGAGDIEGANRLLGRHHMVSGMVVHGNKRGRLLGFPTANLAVSHNMTLIRPGVYITRTWIGKSHYKSVSNVGSNPTFSQTEFTLETYILDHSEDLYHHYISVEFLHRLRDEIRFDSKEQLMERIGADVEEARRYFREPHKAPEPRGAHR